MKQFPLLLFFAFLPAWTVAQGTLDDYKRANRLWSQIHDKVYNVPHFIHWDETGQYVSYETDLKNGQKRLSVVDAVNKIKSEINISEIAEQMSARLGNEIHLSNFPNMQLKIVDNLSLEFAAHETKWRWNIQEKRLEEIEKINIAAEKFRNNHFYNAEALSPDQQWAAFIKDHNLYLRNNQSKTEKQLTFDGNPGEFYESHLLWSSDSKAIAAVRRQKVDTRQITLFESSPTDQLQPKTHTRNYAKPGDALAQRFPVIYNIESDTLFQVDQSKITNQYEIKNIAWDKHNFGITFEYNQRGHQRYDLIFFDATKGETKVIISEQSQTFVDYSSKLFRRDLEKTDEIIWASERDGWNHLYLFDSQTGTLKNQITKGNWVVRNVLHIDEEARKIIFEAGGKNKNEDPYHIHYYSIGFDGKNLKELTPENANHKAYFNRNQTLFVDIFSRIDQNPQAVLRNINGDLVMNLEQSDITDLQATGWKMPEVFTAKGRDGKTDIWGIIIRPTNFDPNKTYPVIENIYAGPHSAHVPKSFALNPSGMHELAELGFIVVQIDGMGTSHRSKAFHDVAWKNLKDAGFPDRIAWMKSAAQKYPQMDLTNVGIYGTSAGGQSSTGALLFYPDFYKVAVSSCGCHDNRMDKIWWNEQWMGWPVGSHYSENSNVDQAHLLQGKLMLIVGEMDDNVDPASTYQLVNQLIKHQKDHEFILVPGMGHSSGGDYGERKRRDFFVKHLLKVTPPAWSEY